jgi:hypothetical protein
LIKINSGVFRLGGHILALSDYRHRLARSRKRTRDALPARIAEVIDCGRDLVRRARTS